jgi:hypothetical protein
LRKLPRCSGIGHREHGLALLADLGPLGDEAQAVEVHVGSAGHGDVGAAGRAGAGGVLLQPGDGEGPSGFEDGAGVGEDVLDRRAHGIRVDADHLVDERAGDPEGLLPHQTHRGAVGEQPDVLELDPVPGLERSGHGVGVVGLHPDDLDVRAQRLDVGRDPGDEPATAHGDEHGIQGAGDLSQDLHADGALPGDDVGVVERVHHRQAALVGEGRGVRPGVGVGVAVQDDLDAGGAHGIHLELGCRGRHDDDGVAAEHGCRARDPLRVVAGGRRDDPGGAGLRAELSHRVVRAADLEREHRLEILALEQHHCAAIRLRLCL